MAFSKKTSTDDKDALKQAKHMFTFANEKKDVIRNIYDKAEKTMRKTISAKDNNTGIKTQLEQYYIEILPVEENFPDKRLLSESFRQISFHDDLLGDNKLHYKANNIKSQKSLGYVSLEPQVEPGFPTWAIVLIVIGAILVFVGIGAAIYCYKKKQ